MGVVKLSKSEIRDYEKYSSMLAGNPAYSPPVFDLLETTVLSSAASSVTFSSLGSYSDYKHLQVRMTSRSDRASTVADLLLTFNGDTGSNYAWHILFGNGSAVNSVGVSSTTRIQFGLTSGASATANIFGAAVFDILDFSNSSKNTTLRSLAGVTNNEIALYSGLWNNTAAVTSFSINPQGTNFVSGTRLSLYGIK